MLAASTSRLIILLFILLLILFQILILLLILLFSVGPLPYPFAATRLRGGEPFHASRHFRSTAHRPGRTLGCSRDRRRGDRGRHRGRCRVAWLLGLPRRAERLRQRHKQPLHEARARGGALPAAGQRLPGRGSAQGARHSPS